MSKIPSEILGELESMDGDDERSDRSASPRAHVNVHRHRPEAAVTHVPRKVALVNRPQTKTRRSTRVTTMAVESAPHHPPQQHTPSKRNSSSQHVLRNVQQDNQESNGNDKSRKRRRPRRKNRKWKPYTQLSWEERQQRDEEESRRASLKRANRLTPYNTTQFLMEDHKVETPDLSSMGAYDENHEMMSSSDEIFENENDDEYLVRNFTAVYDEVQLERLQQMSKEQLVNEVLELSKKVAELEESMRPSSGGGSKEEGKQSSGECEDVNDNTLSKLESVHDLEEKVRKLKEENRQLRTRSSVQT